MKKRSKGFTLIELLVVIAIIGILATIVLVSLNSARAKARDARRKSDIHQISLAMEMAYEGTNAYPIFGADPGSIGTYMTSTPKDPLDPTQVYSWASDGTTYCVTATLEAGGTFYAAE